jgi:hypothetical protein
VEQPVPKHLIVPELETGVQLVFQILMDQVHPVNNPLLVDQRVIEPIPLHVRESGQVQEEIVVRVELIRLEMMCVNLLQSQ